MSFQHNGVSPRYIQRVAENHPGQWICRGHEAPVSWLARSPAFDPLHFSSVGIFGNKNIFKGSFQGTYSCELI
jgi:hypothetical protein